MFQITIDADGTVRLVGVCDSSQVDKVREVLSTVSTTSTVDCADLKYISSAGLGVLLATQKRLSASGQKLKLVNLGETVKGIFLLARFDVIFEIE
ncbi:MAG: STAS domain-containing protein [Bacteroidetes bacterium]|nr:STAS domain-containing protein [Bacteroidota bacterium]